MSTITEKRSLRIPVHSALTGVVRTSRPRGQPGRYCRSPNGYYAE